MNDLSKRSQRLYASLCNVYEVRPRKDKRGVDLISDVLPFGIALESFLIAGCLRVKNILSTIAARFEKIIRKFWKWLTVIDPARINRLMPSPPPKPVHISELRTKLMLCPDCGKEVSTSAMNCPHCGRKLKQSAGGVIAAIIIGLLIACLVFLTIVLERYASRLDVLTDALVATQRSNQPPSLTPEQSPTPIAAPIPRAIPIATPSLTPSPSPQPTRVPHQNPRRHHR